MFEFLKQLFNDLNERVLWLIFSYNSMYLLNDNTLNYHNARCLKGKKKLNISDTIVLGTYHN